VTRDRAAAGRELGRICAGHGLAPRAKRDMGQGMATGHFTVADPVIALTVVNGSLPALLELWFNRPEAHIGSHDD
jgi:hypothetical protein